MNLEKEIFDISLIDIMPNRFQPREMFDQSALQELADSIKEHGVIQPIIVRKVGDKYEIIAGERRFRASQLAGKTTIPAIVKDMDDKEAAKVALLENLQRQDLTPIEEAKTYQTILKLDNLTQDELAANLGKSQSAIANKLRLLQLDEEVQTALLNKKISERHARSLLDVKDLNQQRNLLQQTITNRWTVRQLDDEISKLGYKISQPEVSSPVQPSNIDLTMSSTPEFKFEQPAMPAYEQPTPVVQPIFPSEILNQPLNSAQQPVNNPVMETAKPVETPEIDDNIFAKLRVVQPTENPTPNNEEYKLENKAFNIPEPPKTVSINEPISYQQEPTIPVSMPTIEPVKPTTIEETNRYINPTVPVEPTIPVTQQPVSTTPIINSIKTAEPEPPVNNINAGFTSPTIVNPIEQNPYGNVYDIRFAVNNVRQAIQNTKKFGFNIETEEFDFDSVYQIIIKIDKNKQQ